MDVDRLRRLARQHWVDHRASFDLLLQDSG